jgi:pyruvate dehydrogenase E1 component alpha subunit
VVCETYRLHGHHVGDVDRAYYRSRDEETSWRERDPIALHGAWLLEQGLAGEDDLAGVEARVHSAVEAGVAFALAAPYPDTDEVDEHVYA